MHDLSYIGNRYMFSLLRCRMAGPAGNILLLNMKAKRNTLSSALSFFNNIISRRSSTPTAGRVAPTTGTSTSSPSVPSLRSFHSLPESVPSFSSNQNYLLYSNSPKFRNNFDDVTDVDDALNLFRQMACAWPLPSIIQFNKLLSRILKMRHYSVVVSLYQEMRNTGIPICTYTLNILMDAYSSLNRVDCGFCVLGIHFKCGIEFNVVTFTTLIKGLCLDNKIVDAVELFRKLVRENVCEINQVTCGTLINGLCKTGHTQTAFDLLRMMQKEGTSPSTIDYNIVIDALCKGRMVDEALDLLSEMIGRGILPDKFTYASLIQGLCNFCRWKEVTKLMNEMVLNNVYPDAHIFNILVDAFSKEGKLKNAEAVIQIMFKKNIYADVVTYNTLIKGFCLHNRIVEAIELFRKLVRESV